MRCVRLCSCEVAPARKAWGPRGFWDRSSLCSSAFHPPQQHAGGGRDHPALHFDCPGAERKRREGQMAPEQQPTRSACSPSSVVAAGSSLRGENCQVPFTLEEAPGAHPDHPVSHELPSLCAATALTEHNAATAADTYCFQLCAATDTLPSPAFWHLLHPRQEGSSSSARRCSQTPHPLAPLHPGGRPELGALAQALWADLRPGGTATSTQEGEPQLVSAARRNTLAACCGSSVGRSQASQQQSAEDS